MVLFDISGRDDTNVFHRNAWTNLFLSRFPFRRFLLGVWAGFPSGFVLFILLCIFFPLPFTFSRLLLAVRIWRGLFITVIMNSMDIMACFWRCQCVAKAPGHLQTCGASSCPSSCASWIFYSSSLVENIQESNTAAFLSCSEESIQQQKHSPDSPLVDRSDGDLDWDLFFFLWYSSSSDSEPC